MQQPNLSYPEKFEFYLKESVKSRLHSLNVNDYKITCLIVEGYFNAFIIDTSKELGN